MYTKQEIILSSYREGKSLRKISQDLQINRKTVKKYIKEYESHQEAAGHESETGSLSTCLSTNPGYKVGVRAKVRLTEEIITEIDCLLISNTAKLQTGQRKQMLKKIDILEILHKKGYTIGYTTVCNYIRKKAKKESVKEAFIRQVYEPGRVCEFDWGEIKLEINGELRRFQLAVFTSAYSNYRYSLIFQRQDTLAFMEAHVSFFSHIKGVYHQMVYDNMRVAVSKFVGLHEKEPTRALLQLRGHYMFTHRFCNIYSGNEKGHVERSVEYVRRKAFAPNHTFASIQQAQGHLLATVDRLNHTKQQLTGRTAIDMFQQEKGLLYKSSSPLACSEWIELRADKYSTVSFGTNRYSVPDNLVGCFVEIKVYSHKIEVFHKNNLVAMHERCFERHQWIISIEHYLDTFRKKPGALASSAALAHSPYLKRLYNDFYLETPRDFIELLHYCTHHKVAQMHLEATVSLLINLCTKTIDTEKITALLGNKTTKEPMMSPEGGQTEVCAQNHLEQLSALMN